MKNIFKTIAASVAALMLASSCDVSNLGAIYTPDAEKNQVTFLTTTVNATEIPATDDTFTIDLSRSSAAGELTVALTSTIEGVECPSSVKFEAGKSTTAIVLGVSSLKIGVAYKGKITLATESDFDANIAIPEINVTLQKAYVWESLGNGKLYDPFLLDASTSTTVDLNIQEVEVLKAQGFNLYRMMNPWPKAAVEKAWGDALTGKGPSFVEFTIADDGQVTYGKYVNTGYTYNGGNLLYYNPTDFEEAGQEYNCTIENGTVVQFYWYQYTTAGSWWGRSYPSYLALPSFSGDFEKWLL